MIYLTGFESASAADVLDGTRLSSIPYGGQLTIQASSNANNAANNYVMTIQLPDGSVPVDGQRVTAGPADEVLGGSLNTRYVDQWSFPASQGGHFTISFVETGAALVTWRIVLRP